MISKNKSTLYDTNIQNLTIKTSFNISGNTLLQGSVTSNSLFIPELLFVSGNTTLNNVNISNKTILNYVTINSSLNSTNITVDTITILSSFNIDKFEFNDINIKNITTNTLFVNNNAIINGQTNKSFLNISDQKSI